MLLISKVSKVHKGPSIQSNVTHVEGVEIAYRPSQYRVMLLMLKVSKVAQYTLKGCNALYVEGVKRSSKWFYTSLLITFLIFNQFPIQKKFWKAETESFPTISNAMYVEACWRR